MDVSVRDESSGEKDEGLAGGLAIGTREREREREREGKHS